MPKKKSNPKESPGFDIIKHHSGDTRTAKYRTELVREFSRVVNSHSIECDSNTPDFIIGEYLVDCLLAFQLGVCKRTVWYNPEGKQ